MAAVEIPRLTKGDDARVDLRLTRRALEASNDRLEQSRGWYDGVRGAFRKQ